MGHKLSLLQRQYSTTGWHQSKQFDKESIQKVQVDGAGKGKSLNAIPSPFARIHLFEAAFDMVYQDLINNTKLAGDAYNKLVSDCLDVFELIYNWNSHTSEGKNLEILIWHRETEIYNLINSKNVRHKLLGETLNTFLNGEEALKDFGKCCIIKYNGQVIAGSSPLTGFFTTPNDLSNFGLLKPLSQIAYFSRTIPFQDRKSDIKKYIYDFFEKNDFLRSRLQVRSIREFLDWQNSQGKISNELLELKPLQVNGISVNLFETILLTAKSIGTQYFENQIVRINYRLNSACFVLGNTTEGERSYDYLLPLTTSFFEEFNVEQVNQIVKIEEKQDSVEVHITINGKKIFKKYVTRTIHESDGKIIDLYNDYQINFNLGIFPFLKIINQPEEVGFNDFYRVMITLDDPSFTYSNKDINLKFGKDKFIIENGAVFQINQVDRNVLEKGKIQIGSTFISLNTCFDFLQIEFPFLYNGESVRSMIVPRWKEKAIGNKQIDFAIDLGTTSTFIAYTDDNSHQTQPKPFEFNENEIPVVLLNRPKEKRADIRWIDCFESAPPNLLLSIEVQKQQFIPSIIKKKEIYEFPIRTVLNEKKGLASNNKKTLQNSNISFVYQKTGVGDLGLTNEEIITNLKWNINANANYTSSINVFIEELFILIRTKILLNDGDPRKSKICWFSPLSFTVSVKNSYTDLWNKYAKAILKYNGNNIYNLTESEAPFHYLFRNATINNPNSVLTLDIGGGSTDIMLIKQKTPVLGTSVHFGANVLWGNGFSSFNSEKTNGIYLALKNHISEMLRKTELKKANEDYCSDNNSFAGSDEIINFWIANNNITGILDRLKSGEFRLSYLLHLSALIYQTLKLLKVNNQIPPTCIIYSGNGSKYIDLIHDAKCIEKIWGYFARKIFDDNISNPQVILPQENRKEATCYGGLFVPQPAANINVENYLGFEKQGEKYQKYRDIENDKVNVFNRTIVAVNEFINWFFEMNESKDLNFRIQFGIESKLNSIKKYMIEKSEENLNLGFIKRLEQVDKDDFISDSIFYYPIVGLIYKINKLTLSDIDNLIDKTIYYFNAPAGDCEFIYSNIDQQLKTDSIYTITIENESPNVGVLEIINNSNVHKRALAAYQGFLNPVCSYEEFPEPNQEIKILEPGKVVKNGDKWVVTEKIKIQFV